MDSDLTAYQRGNRDGLLSIAGLFDKLAAGQRLDADRMDSHAQRRGIKLHTIRAAERLRDQALYKMQQWTAAADMARRQAEMLPEDPEA